MFHLHERASTDAAFSASFLREWRNPIAEKSFHMFHMLSCFNLKPGIELGCFEQSLAELDEYLRNIDLVHSTGRIGRRNRHRIMDTDQERDHEFFFIMTFRDREQCDRSVEHVLSEQEPGASIHRAVWQKVEGPVFICWEDI